MQKMAYRIGQEKRRCIAALHRDYRQSGAL
jgi:hypothetical protein